MNKRNPYRNRHYVKFKEQIHEFVEDTIISVHVVKHLRPLTLEFSHYSLVVHTDRSQCYIFEISQEGENIRFETLGYSSEFRSIYKIPNKNYLAYRKSLW